MSSFEDSQQQQPGPSQAPMNVSTFPPPPWDYIRHYSDEMMQNGTSPAPPPPIAGTYFMFGKQYHTDDPIIQSLESQGIRRLYPTGQFDHKVELKKINHSIVANFLDLIDILIRDPASPERERKLDDLRDLFINMHHLLNEYRPHQARETLRMMMVRQLKDRLHTVENFEKFYEVISQNLRQCLADLPLQYSIPKTVEQALDEIFAEEDSRKATEKETEENEEMEKFDPIKEEEIEKIVSWKLAKRIQDEK